MPKRKVRKRKIEVELWDYASEDSALFVSQRYIKREIREGIKCLEETQVFHDAKFKNLKIRRIK